METKACWDWSSDPGKGKSFGFTGPMLRGSGVAWDLRDAQPYEVYDRLEFNVPVGKEGDLLRSLFSSYGRVEESNKLIKQCVNWLKSNPGPVMVDNHKVAPLREST